LLNLPKKVNILIGPSDNLMTACEAKRYGGAQNHPAMLSRAGCRDDYRMDFAGAALTFLAPLTDGHPRPFLRGAQEAAMKSIRAQEKKISDLFFMFGSF
jgi:hypothetical protein